MVEVTECSNTVAVVAEGIVVESAQQPIVEVNIAVGFEQVLVVLV